MNGKYVLNIHFENPEVHFLNDFCNLMKLIRNKTKFIVSVTPSQLKGDAHDINFYGEVEHALRVYSNNGSIEIAQQGRYHHCPFCFDEAENKPRNHVDPWHEFDCLYNKIPIEKQEKLINEGKEILADFLEVVPTIFSPPNHMYDKNTIKVLSEQGFQYITDISIWHSTSPCKHKNGMIILPESNGEKELKRDGGILYMHNDKINWKVLDSIKNNLVSLEEYVESKKYKKSLRTVKWDNRIKHFYKWTRDLKNLVLK